MSDEKIESNDGKKLILAKPPDEVFLFRKRGANSHQTQEDAKHISSKQNELIPMLDQTKGYNGVTYPETGGQYVWHVGREYPRKGHVYGEALRDCFYPKRILINLIKFLGDKDNIPFFIVFALMPKWLRGRIIGRAISSFAAIVNDVLYDHYLHPQFNTSICRALSEPIMTFLKEIGVEEVHAFRMSLIFITLLEYDMAYRLRIEDLLSETTKEKLMKDPVGEAERLIKILAQRDPSRPRLVDKFARFVKIFRYGYWFIRKPFKKALAQANFELMQLDDVDRYQVRHWTGYNWFGMTIEERIEKWKPVSSPAYRLEYTDDIPKFVKQEAETQN